MVDCEKNDGCVADRFVDCRWCGAKLLLSASSRALAHAPTAYASSPGVVRRGALLPSYSISGLLFFLLFLSACPRVNGA